jgi:hypothetical protein
MAWQLRKTPLFRLPHDPRTSEINSFVDSVERFAQLAVRSLEVPGVLPDLVKVTNQLCLAAEAPALKADVSEAGFSLAFQVMYNAGELYQRASAEAGGNAPGDWLKCCRHEFADGAELFVMAAESVYVSMVKQAMQR